MIWSPFFNVIEGIVDSCRDSVEPKIGSIVYCDLAFGIAEHSGVYIGNGRIVNLAGTGRVEIVTPKYFISGTTAMNIYVSCYEKNSVGCSIVADRALSMAREKRNYRFLLDNCHQFTAGCITGDFENTNNFLWMMKDEAKKELGVNTWRYWDIKLFD